MLGHSFGNDVIAGKFITKRLSKMATVTLHRKYFYSLFITEQSSKVFSLKVRRQVKATTFAEKKLIHRNLTLFTC